MRLLKITALSALLILLGMNTVHSQNKSEYVSLKADFCRPPAAAVRKNYLARGLTVSECPTKITVQSLPLQLFIVSTDERSWLDIVLGNTIWSTEEEIIYEKENQFGHFPNIGNAPAEIRMNSAGGAGLIFRVTAQNSDLKSSTSGSSNVSRLFVVGFRDSGVCFLGLVRDNILARILLDSNEACKRMLKIEEPNTRK